MSSSKDGEGKASGDAATAAPPVAAVTTDAADAFAKTATELATTVRDLLGPLLPEVVEACRREATFRFELFIGQLCYDSVCIPVIPRALGTEITDVQACECAAVLMAQFAAVFAVMLSKHGTTKAILRFAGG